MGQGNWTEEQWEAINTRGCDILVAAAAGSGKTAVLVERIITMITQCENPMDIDRLLVVTFTSAAAAEMRERVGDAIVKKIDENPNNEHLQRQMTLLNRAKITTIHSFCLEVIRENYNTIEIDPAFRIADDTENSLMKSELIEEIFEEYYSEEGNESFIALVESYGENTKDNRLRELILTIHTFVQSSPFPNEWIDEMTERFHIEEGVVLDDTFWGQIINGEIRFELNGLYELTKMALAVIDGYKIEEYRAAILQDLELLENLKNSVDKNLNTFYECITEAEISKLGRKKKDSDEGAIEKIKSLRDDFKDGIKSIKEKIFYKCPDDLKNDMIKLYPIIRSLGNVVKRFSEKFQNVKKEKLLVDFNDLEHYCLQVLLEQGSTVNNPIPSRAAIQLQQRFEEILTDEYQDSNLVQEMILSVVSRKNTGGNNRFMVGDVKQSIYRFRLAKPALFMEKYNSFSTEGKGKEVRIDLFKNFRSRDTVLDGINFLFRQLMTQDLGEIVYDERAALNAGAIFEKIDEDRVCGGAIELDLIDFTKPEEDDFYDDLTEELEELSNTELEVNHIGQRIQEMLNSGYCVWDKILKKYRKIEYGDIVILLRAPNSWSSIFIEEFSRYGIPAYADTNSGYFETIEIMCMIHLLKVIDNPRQDISLIATLRSPIYKCSSDELLDIRIEGGKENFYDCIFSYRNSIENNETMNKLNRFIEDLNRWRDYAVYMPIDELLWILYNETDYIDYIGATPGGRVRQANLRALLDKAVQYENTSFKGLFHFIKYIEKIQSNHTDMGAAKILSENENLVKIMSIHKSKGLEFPVVFVSGLGKKFNKTDITKPVLLHQDLGFGSTFVDYENRVTYNTIARTTLSRLINKENLSEEMRILYVALTRAKEKLILTGGIRGLDKVLLKWSMFTNEKGIELPHYNMSKANNYLDWIVPAVSRHRDCELISDRAGIFQLNQKNGLYDDKSKWKVSIISRFDSNSQRIDKEIDSEITRNILNEWNSQVNYSGEKEEISRRLKWIYSYQESTKLPANISISEIKRRYQQLSQEEETPEFEQKIIFDFPSFLQKEKGLTASEKGTAVHTLMERLDFEKEHSQNSIMEYKAKCIEMGILTEEESKSINISKIIQFFDSEMGIRLRKADKIEKEKVFAMKLSPREIDKQWEGLEEDILIHGIIDCFFYEGDEIVLLDYKTDYVKDGMEQEMKERYQIQINLYRRAIENIAGKKVKEAYIYLFGIDKLIEMM